MKVNEKLTTISLYEFEGRLVDVIARLREIRDAHPGKELKLDLRSQEYSDGQEYAVVWERPENEAEKAKREEQAKQSKEYRRQQYENLKKEFEQ